MSKLVSMLNWMPTRFIALLGALVLGVIVWLLSKLFPAIDRHTIAYVGAFVIAAILAFSIRPRRQF